MILKRHRGQEVFFTGRWSGVAGLSIVSHDSCRYYGSMGTRFIHLIRHGQFVIDKKEPDKGSLTELGARQAHFVALRLKEFPLTTLHFSPTPRAEQTARIIGETFPGIPYQKNELLVEGLPWVNWWVILKDGLNVMKIFRTRRRMERAFKELFTSYSQEGDRHDAIVCHGNIIRYFVCRSMGVHISAWTKLLTANASLTTVRIHDGDVRLVCYADVGHIPFSDRTII